ncbi:hypothetical protein [Paenibacillus taichungensis]
MLKTEFRRKVRIAFPGQPVAFEHNEVQNGALVGNFFFHNMVHSEVVLGQWNGKSIGRAPGIEHAVDWDRILK